MTPILTDRAALTRQRARAAAAPALAAFDKIHWIVGGQAKEPGLGECEQHMDRVTAAYTIGDQVRTAHAGDILVGPADVPHAFRNLGPGRLRTLDIHMNDRWIQEDLEA